MRPTKVVNPKIGLIQFCLTIDTKFSDVETEMDIIMQEQRKNLTKVTKEVAQTGCNVLLIQRSELRDTTDSFVLHLLAKLNIMVVRDVEPKDVELICKTLGCTPAVELDQLTVTSLGEAKLAQESYH
jgi:T-complex protein 1 subunit delta